MRSFIRIVVLRLTQLPQKGLSGEGLDLFVDQVDVSVSKVFFVLKKDSQLAHQALQWNASFFCMSFKTSENIIESLLLKVFLQIGPPIFFRCIEGGNDFVGEFF